MVASDEIRRIITILIEEGFGALAGELLTEISLGREIEIPAGAVTPLQGPEDGETFVVRVPIADEQQLAEAISLLRLRLVEPVRALAEAERIAGELVGVQGVRIRFINPEERKEIEALSSRDIADRDLADELDDLLGRLPRMIEPPASTEI